MARAYSVLAINLYAFLPCTVATTGANAPDCVVLTGNVIVSVDYLIQYFSARRTRPRRTRSATRSHCMSRGGRDDVNSTRPSDKSQNLEKLRRDAERRERAWHLRVQWQATRRKKAQP